MHNCTGIVMVIDFQAKRRKRWLVRHNRVLSLDRAQCNVILDDITWEKIGLGSYYTVNSYATGQVMRVVLFGKHFLPLVF